MKFISSIILISLFYFNVSAMEQKEKGFAFFSKLPQGVKQIIISYALYDKIVDAENVEKHIKKLFRKYMDLKLIQKEFKSILETKKDPQELDLGLKIIAEQLSSLEPSKLHQLVCNLQTLNKICSEAAVPESQAWDEEFFDLIRKKFGGPRWREHKVIDLPLAQVEKVEKIGKEIFYLRKNKIFNNIIWHTIYSLEKKLADLHYGAKSIHQLIFDGEFKAIKDLHNSYKPKIVAVPFDLRYEDSNGNTPLHIAAQRDNFEIVKFLTSENILLDQKNDLGNTALDIAKKNGFDDIRRHLISIQYSFMIE